MSELKRIELTVKSEEDLKGKYGDWEIVEIDTENEGTRYYAGRFEDGYGKLKLRSFYESRSGLRLGTNIEDWKNCHLGTLDTLKDIELYGDDEWITYVILRKNNELIYAEVTDGKVFK